MGLGQLFTKRVGIDQHSRVLDTSGFQFVIGGAAFPFSATQYGGAMAIPGAWRCSLLLSDLLGQVPWNAYRERAGRPVEKLTPTPPLLDQPAPPHARMTTISSMALDLIFHGNAIGLVAARNAEGWPTAILPTPADCVGVRRRSDGSVEYSVGGTPFEADDVLHVMGPCRPGELRGLGVLEAHLCGSLGLAQEQARQTEALTRHGVPTGLLKVANPDATKEDLTVVKTGWLAAQRDRTVAVLNAGTDFTPLAWNPEELQLIEARKFSLHEQALIFGVPLSFVGADGASRTYSNIEQEAINLIKFSLSGHLARFEQAFALAFPRGTWVKANLDAILRADTLTRYQAHGLAISNGFLTVDEVRALEDRPPLPQPIEPAPEPQAEDTPVEEVDTPDE